MDIRCFSDAFKRRGVTRLSNDWKVGNRIIPVIGNDEMLQSALRWIRLAGGAFKVY